MQRFLTILLSVLVGGLATAAYFSLAITATDCYLLFAAISVATLIGSIIPAISGRLAALKLPKLGTSRQQGEVRWFNARKGFGFITASNGDDVFLHQKEIRLGNRRSLKPGQQISFDIVQGDKGPQASNIDVVDE